MYPRKVKLLLPCLLAVVLVLSIFNLGRTGRLTKLRLASEQDPMQAKVIEMTKHAWSGYYKYARYSDELMPQQKLGYNWTQYPVYMTAIDSLDTLFIMDLKEEYEQAKEIVLEKMDFDQITEIINHFEVNIRVLGGLLSANELDPDARYVEKAIDLADRLLLAFDTNTGFPRSRIFLNKPTTENYGLVSMATIGTLQLEFQYLSDITGNATYQDKALYVYDKLQTLSSSIPGLFPTAISVDTLAFDGPERYGVGGENDSFYEYLLKIYLATGLEKYKTWYLKAEQALIERVVEVKGNYTFCPDIYPTVKDNQFHHLTCFAGGMFTTSSVAIRNENHAKVFDIGKNITETCMQMYTESQTGLGGELVSVSEDSLFYMDPRYLLRPEVIESVFYLWRYTKNEKYRAFGRKMISKLEEHCRDETGYHTLNAIGSPGDKMESFFMAETLKYLFLLFSDDSILSHEYVFNTEAHPLARRGFGQRKNPSKWAKIKDLKDYKS